jgi:hypothetical protein
VHPVIEEINRARPGDPIRADVLRRWQQALRNDVQPQLDELDALRAPVLTPKSKKESA